jgi:hypothetical protein
MLISLLKIVKTLSGANDVLHHPSEACDGVEVVVTMGR